MGTWGFNSAYLTGIDLANLPLEEWLFFICIPYACFFTYEAFHYYFKKPPFVKAAYTVFWTLFALSVLLAVFNFGSWYAFFTSVFTREFLLFILRWFLLTCLSIVIPFLISNGVLSGFEFWNYPLINSAADQVSDQIVWHNHNFGIRIFSIPVDDFLYGFLLILMNVVFYEKFLNRQ